MRNKILMVVIMFIVMTIACDQSNQIINTNENVESEQLAHSLSKSSSITIIIGPEVFTRGEGKPKMEEIEFIVESNFSNTQLILTNGGEDKKTKVTSCFVVLNLDTLIYPIDINKDVDNIKTDVILRQENLLQVKLAGKPGSYCTIKIEGEEGCPCTMTDIDGNVYQTVQIGDQCWMAENLKVTHYRNEDAIHHVEVKDTLAWGNLKIGAYSANDKSDSPMDYGFLYNWYAINDSSNIAPVGWHVPTDDEWKELEIYLGMSSSEANIARAWRSTDVGGKLKESGFIHWNRPNKGATNESGFTALPAGYRHYITGVLNSICYDAVFWTATEYDNNRAWMRFLDWRNSGIYRGYDDTKSGGFSVRLIKD